MQDQQGVDLNIQSLLIYAAILGFSGLLISLAISKWTAKRMTGAQVITSPTNDRRVNTVQKQAQQADTGMLEVAIYNSSALNAFVPA